MLAKVILDGWHEVDGMLARRQVQTTKHIHHRVLRRDEIDRERDETDRIHNVQVRKDFKHQNKRLCAHMKGRRGIVRTSPRQRFRVSTLDDAV